MLFQVRAVLLGTIGSSGLEISGKETVSQFPSFNSLGHIFLTSKESVEVPETRTPTLFPSSYIEYEYDAQNKVSPSIQVSLLLQVSVVREW